MVTGKHQLKIEYFEKVFGSIVMSTKDCASGTCTSPGWSRQPFFIRMKRDKRNAELISQKFGSLLEAA